MKMKFGLANADTVDVYVDPNILAGEPGSPTASISATDLSFDRVLTSNFHSMLITADEIRFGSTFKSVVVPEPSTVMLAGLAFLGLVGCARRRQ
jgi:PEP-CTERM motif